MIPILYEKTETAFTSNGICRLPDMISGTVTEERNGIFIAEFEYPVDGENYAEIQIGRIIFCSCSQGNKQPFEIYEASRPINGRVLFVARHLTYRGNFIPIEPFTMNNATALAVMESMRDNHVIGRNDTTPITCPFSFDSTISTLNNYKQDEPAVLRSRLGGVEGSILDVYGGEYEWGYDFTNQRPLIKLWAHRGANRGVQIKYGKNLTDLQQDETIENMITGVVAFYKNEETCVYSDVVKANVGGQYTDYPRISTLDVSGDFPEVVPTKAQLNAKAQSYIDSHDIGVPEVNLSISFVNLADTEEYKDVAVLEQVKLCDTVEVVFEKLGVSAISKVVKTIWNILLDKYDGIELGEGRTNIATQIIEQDDAIRDIKENVPQLVDVQAAIDRATKLITGATGGYVVIKQDDNTGYPKEILIMDTPDINTATKVWRWNIAGLAYSSQGYVPSAFDVAITMAGEILGKFIAANSIEGNSIKANAITTDKLDAKAVTAAKIDSGAVTTDKLDARAVTSDKIAANAITANMISGQLTDAQIAGLAATKLSGQINTGSIGWINLSDGTFKLAGGRFKYTNGSYIELLNNLSLQLNGVPLAGRRYYFDTTDASTRYVFTDIYAEVQWAFALVVVYPYQVTIELKFELVKTNVISANTMICKNLPAEATPYSREPVQFEMHRLTPRTEQHVRGRIQGDSVTSSTIYADEAIGSSSSANNWVYSALITYPRDAT